MRSVISWDSLDFASTASRRLNILLRYTSTDKICRSFVNYKKVRRKTVFQFVKMIIRLLSHTFFILTFITYSAKSAIFENFENLQILEIRSFRNIRTLSLALGYKVIFLGIYILVDTWSLSILLFCCWALI